FQWAGEALRLPERAPAVDAALTRRMVEDLKVVAPSGAATLLNDAGVGLLEARGASKETREFAKRLRAFLADAARELGDRAVQQRAQELANNKAQSSGDKSAAKLLKELEKDAAASPAEVLAANGQPALAALLRNKGDA